MRLHTPKANTTPLGFITASSIAGRSVALTCLEMQKLGPLIQRRVPGDTLDDCMGHEGAPTAAGNSVLGTAKEERKRVRFATLFLGRDRGLSVEDGDCGYPHVELTAVNEDREHIEVANLGGEGRRI